MFKRLIFLVVAMTSLATHAGAQTVVQSNLFDDLSGFGRDTTGGLGQELYVVTTNRDSGLRGSLRYALERGNYWIVFDRSLFNRSNSALGTMDALIELERPLVITKGNITIDGRAGFVGAQGRRVVIRRNHRWSDYEHDGVGGCRRIDGQFDAVMRFPSTKNVVISHVAFYQLTHGTVPPGVVEEDCLGDTIQIYNPAHVQGTGPGFTDFWINRSDFRQCRDGCIDVTRPTNNLYGDLTISRNLFSGTYKTMLMGNLIASDTQYNYRIRASLYLNHFSGADQRQPTMKGMYAHIFNNFYESWGLRAVDSRSATRIFVEQNLFRAGARKTNAIDILSSDSADAAIWTDANSYYNGAIDVDSRFRSMDRSRSYYQDAIGTDVSIMDIKSMSYSAASTYLRGESGWVAEESDVY